MFLLFQDRYLGDGATGRREILHDGLYMCFFPFGCDTPKGPKIRNFWPKFWPFNLEYFEKGKSQRYMSIRANIS